VLPGDCSGFAVDHAAGVPTHPRPRRPEGDRTHPPLDHSPGYERHPGETYQGDFAPRPV